MWMPKSTQKVVIANLKTLMTDNGDSTYSLAKRSGIPQSTVSRFLNNGAKISVEAAEQLAGAYGLEGWHLLMRDLPNDLLKSKRLEKLYERYRSASSEARDYIDSVAERESKYNTPD